MPYAKRRSHTLAIMTFGALLAVSFAFSSFFPAQAWVKTKPTAPLPWVNPYQVGRWSTSFNLGGVVHAAVLPNAKVLYWSQFSFPPTYTRLWCGGAAATAGCTDTTQPDNFWYYPTYLFCSGHSLLPDGKVLITGGSEFDQALDGSKKVTIFDPTNNTFGTGLDMAHGRWYPTNVTLGNGETLVASGTYCANRQSGPKCLEFVVNNIPDVFSSNGQTIRSLTGATDQIPLYPWLHLGSDGRVFYSGPNSPGRWLNTTQPGQWGATLRPYYYSPLTNRSEGSSVMYDTDKVLIAGGGDNPPTNTAEIINLVNEGNWTSTGSMAYARRHLNLTILADGKVLATGGTRGSGFNNGCAGNPVKEGELWDPDFGTWTTMAAENNPRLYHSTAMLLVDGRVLVGGGTPTTAPGDPCFIDSQNENEIFTPPYLYNPDGSDATRPTISYAPATVSYGQQFQVNTPSGPSITKVTMVRLSSVTHSVNMNQRFNNLSFSHVGGGVRVNAPANGNVAPPGHYMLFLISGRVPSIAKIVQIS